MGKGSSPRPIVNRAIYEKNWDQIFGKKEKNNGNSSSDKPTDKKKID